MIKDTLFAKYIAERQGLSILENENSFILYKLSGDECFIAEMFVDTSIRGKGRGRSMIDSLAEIAKDAGCKVITGNIHTNDPGASNTLLASLTCGFKVARAEHGVILIAKEIKES